MPVVSVFCLSIFLQFFFFLRLFPSPNIADVPTVLNQTRTLSCKGWQPRSGDGVTGCLLLVWQSSTEKHQCRLSIMTTVSRLSQAVNRSHLILRHIVHATFYIACYTLRAAKCLHSVHIYVVHTNTSTRAHPFQKHLSLL